MSELINKLSRFLVGLKRCFVKFNESSLFVWSQSSSSVWDPERSSPDLVREILCRSQFCTCVMADTVGEQYTVCCIIDFWKAYRSSPRHSPETGSHIQSVWCNNFECWEIHINQLTELRTYDVFWEVLITEININLQWRTWDDLYS